MADEPSYRRNALVSGGIFFIFWLAVLYAGADHPPPPGFVAIVFLVGVCALLVYYRVPTYIGWYRQRKPHRLLYVLLDGLVAGAAAGLLVMLLPGGGEPTAVPTVGDRILWFAILGLVGMANSVAVHAANVFAVRWRKSGA